MLRAAAGCSRRALSSTALRAQPPYGLRPASRREPPPHIPADVEPVPTSRREPPPHTRPNLEFRPKDIPAVVEPVKKSIGTPLTDTQWAAVEPTELTVFHDPADVTSKTVLAALQAAALQYPKSKEHPSKTRGPLKLAITVFPRPPDADEFREIATHLTEVSFAAFLRKTNHWPTSAGALAALVEKDPTLLTWPVVVDWEHRQSSLGGKGYINLLKDIAARRSLVLKPKVEVPPPPQPIEWIDYD
ncbi:hypothetical protein DFH09DRAFT_595066 [Mycena vulgaris]|nr:hypothetical protein DFH09DRAFT_595066 [Mycena vulgaris]